MRGRRWVPGVHASFRPDALYVRCMPARAEHCAALQVDVAPAPGNSGIMPAHYEIAPRDCDLPLRHPQRTAAARNMRIQRIYTIIHVPAINPGATSIDSRGAAPSGTCPSRNRSTRTHARSTAIDPHHSADGGQRGSHPGNGGLAGKIDQRDRVGRRCADRRGRSQHARRTRRAVASFRISSRLARIRPSSTDRRTERRTGRVSPSLGVST